MRIRKLSNGISLISSNDEDDDNCPVCQLMRSVDQEGREPTMEELKIAMEKSENQGAIVGGEIFGRPV